MSKRLLLAIATVLTLFVPASALAGTRAMSIQVPKSITEDTIFTAKYTGDTGPGNAALGGFIIYARLVKGSSCPANAAIPKHSNIVDINGGNFFGSGAFNGADRVVAYDAGKYQVCGYITQNSGTIAYDLVYQGKVTVKKRKGFHTIGKLPKITNGTYTALTPATGGGNPDASVTFTVTGGHVVSAAVTGVPTVSCFDGFTTQTPLTTAGSSNVPVTGPSGNQVYNTMHAAFTAPGFEELDINGGAVSSKTIYGSVTGVSADGSCTGSFAFVATRAK